MKAQFTIKQRRPWRNSLAVLVLAGIVGGGGYYFYHRERGSGDVVLMRLEMKQDALLRDNSRLGQENIDLKARIAILERSRQIDGKAYGDVDQHLKRLQGEMLALREELAFYRGIVSSSDVRGVFIHTLALEREGNTDAYRYSLVLTRNMRNGKVVSGTVDLSVSGELNGELKQLSREEMVNSAAPVLAFKFKYFQRLEGRLRLPKDFVPHRVYVKVHTPGSRPSRVEKAFDWSRAVG